MGLSILIKTKYYFFDDYFCFLCINKIGEKNVLSDFIPQFGCSVAQYFI